MAEAVACNNELRKLIIEDEDGNCYVMIWVIIWATMLAKVWKSMMEYISREADWFENEVILKL